MLGRDEMMVEEDCMRDVEDLDAFAEGCSDRKVSTVDGTVSKTCSVSLDESDLYRLEAMFLPIIPRPGIVSVQ